ncbi:hypothetical protein EV175_001915 [Coemansia sp. RSA 1933]|nr:hypothetical protein EV175_001915 [Coemansia sp. RSA 1933]
MDFSSALEFTDNSPYLSGSDAQRTMPITPNMGVDAFLAASTNGMGNVFHHNSTHMLPMSVTHVMAPVPMAGTAPSALPVTMAAQPAATGSMHSDLVNIFGDAQMFDNTGNRTSMCEYPPISFGATPTTVASDDYMGYARPLDKMHDNILNELLPSSVSASPAHSSFGAPSSTAMATHPLFADMGVADAFASPEMVAAAMAAAVAATATPGAGVANFSLATSEASTHMFSPMVPGFSNVGDGASLFGQLGYADGGEAGGISASNHAANDAAAAAMGSNSGSSIGKDADMHGYARARVGSANLSPFTLPPEMLDIAAPPTSAGSVTVSSGRSITSGFGNISLDSATDQTGGGCSFQPPRRAASYASRLSRMRPKRSLSSGKIANARMSPFTSGPSTSVHPYMPHCCTSPGGGPAIVSELVASPRMDRLYSHSRSGSDALIAGLTATDLSRAQSITSLQNSPFVKDEASVAGEAEGEHDDDDDDSSSSSDASDNESSEQNAAAGTLQRGGKTSGSGRIALTNEQRSVFFQWLYLNAHDPKPKGKERDRLRGIGNMSRGRFKTWFANARRRYFHVTTGADGKQKYTINERFRVACQRSNIELE